MRREEEGLGRSRDCNWYSPSALDTMSKKIWMERAFGGGGWKGNTLYTMPPVYSLVIEIWFDQKLEKLSLLGKTGRENLLGRMHGDTVGDPKGKPAQKPNRNLQLLESGIRDKVTAQSQIQQHQKFLVTNIHNHLEGTSPTGTGPGPPC